jgi:hypothetical protein
MLLANSGNENRGNEGVLAKTWTWKRILSTVAVFAVSLASIIYVVAFFWRASPKELLGLLICAMIIVAFGLLGRRFPAFHRAFDRVISAGLDKCIRVLASSLALSAPIVFFRWLPTIIFRVQPWVQVIGMLAWGLILAFALALIATNVRRKHMFEMLRRVGSFAPVIYSLDVLFIAVIFFSTVTYILASHGRLGFDVPKEREHLIATPMFLYGAMQDFFLWHFLDAVPLLKVNETLHWSEPLTYTSPAVGSILLMFKITVIVPVTAAFVAYWKRDSEASPKE